MAATLPARYLSAFSASPCCGSTGSVISVLSGVCNIKDCCKSPFPHEVHRVISGSSGEPTSIEKPVPCLITYSMPPLLIVYDLIPVGSLNPITPCQITFFGLRTRAAGCRRPRCECATAQVENWVLGHKVGVANNVFPPTNSRSELGEDPNEP